MSEYIHSGLLPYLHPLFLPKDTEVAFWRSGKFNCLWLCAELLGMPSQPVLGPQNQCEQLVKPFTPTKLLETKPLTSLPLDSLGRSKCDIESREKTPQDV